MTAAESAVRRVRVLVVDDHAAIRAGLRLMLGTAGDLEVVGEAGDGDAAVRLARELRPDVVLMDVRMPTTDGITATRAIVEERLAEVLVLTTFDLDEYVFGALQAGAGGFLLKTAEAAELTAAVRAVARGDGALSPEVTRRVLAAAARPAAGAVAVAQDSPAPVRDPGLTARELDVLRCLGDGLSNAGIAQRLVITEATAKTHVSHVLTKLGAASRVQAALAARDLGLLGG